MQHNVTQYSILVDYLSTLISMRFLHYKEKVMLTL